MTREMTRDISQLLFQALLRKHITLVVIASSQTFQFSWGFFTATFSVFTATFLGVPCSTGLEQLLKYQLGVWVAPTTNFKL